MTDTSSTASTGSTTSRASPATRSGGSSSLQTQREYSVIRYVPPSGDFAIDLISRLGEAFVFEDLRWEVVQREGVAIRVATPGTLYRMKRDTVRWRDKVDADRLRERFDLRLESD